MKYLIDTHILLWWYLDDPKLPKRYHQLLQTSEEAQESVALSVMSLWEIAKLVSLKKLNVTFSLDEWFDELEQDAGLKVLPLNSRIILESSRLGEKFHRDPVDQLVVATARVHGLRLLTVDHSIKDSGMAAIA